MSDNDDLTIAYMAGYDHAKKQYSYDIERLREMLIEARDDATRFGRLMQKCVIALREVARCDFQAWARNALEKDADAQKQTLERIAQYDMQKIAIDALEEGKE
jgi:multidrug resistance efflux pump